MKWFNHLRISAKLISSFTVIAILSGFIGVIGLMHLNSMDLSMSRMYDSNLVPISDLSQVQTLYQNINVDLRDMNILSKTEADNQSYKDQILAQTKEIEKRMDQFAQAELVQSEKDDLEQFAIEWKRYNGFLNEALRMNSENISTEQFTNYLLDSGFKDSGDKLEAIAAKLVSTNIRMAKEAREDSDRLYQSSRTMTFAIIVAALIISVGLGVVIARIIARPLNRMVRLVGKVATGDLSETSDIDTKDEVGVLAASVNDMVFNLRSTVGGILVSAESVSAASQQISAATEEIASGSMSQANAAQTMSELFRELSLAINTVAQSAEQASELSNQTISIARDGGEILQSSIDGMSRVNERMSMLEEDSNKVGEIIKVIDDIAGQTNLLALNAAIEAARAGDQGRGFAVVADEVRKLAERSSEATKQITKIIQGMQNNTAQSVKAVEDGVVASRKTGEAFGRIMTMVNETAHRVTDIAAASEQQAAQSSEVLISIESISSVTEETAAGSEETAATAQSLARLAEELNGSVSLFKL
ncbi:methyl-accepting chemotaxis protein [Cohnella herbarum]|uniref:Methyl-accepting chemotaxis protein n=1 Tax=Cohnella herbarum TaxID=2728023 RepID=A0A7Z2VLM8_9BACL|nr:methyl-accepting chemotaxis protein [Cohnella herbarum]QJD85518.1 methyl-accepting chemotaxis protein [Cohnella herbarum]